jgi:hypothetical protein
MAFRVLKKQLPKKNLHRVKINYVEFGLPHNITQQKETLARPFYKANSEIFLGIKAQYGYYFGFPNVHRNISLIVQMI